LGSREVAFLVYSRLTGEMLSQKEYFYLLRDYQISQKRPGLGGF
jgi:hypothetical protein